MAQMMQGRRLMQVWGRMRLYQVSSSSRAQRLTPGYNRIPREEGIIPGKILATVNTTRKIARSRKEAVKGEPIWGAQCLLRMS